MYVSTENCVGAVRCSCTVLSSTVNFRVVPLLHSLGDITSSLFLVGNHFESSRHAAVLRSFLMCSVTKNSFQDIPVSPDSALDLSKIMLAVSSKVQNNGFTDMLKSGLHSISFLYSNADDLL